MSIHLIKKKNREGKIYVYLVEAFRDGKRVRQRTLESFGRLDVLEAEHPNWFQEKQEEIKHLSPTVSPKELVLRFDLQKPLSEVSQNYGWKILDDLFHFLNMGKVTGNRTKLTNVLRLLVFQRLINPQSKLATVASQPQLFGDWNLTENDIYRSLDKLEALSSDIQLELHKTISKKIGRTATLVFYDVTNYYFETDMNDQPVLNENGEIEKEGLRRRGPSKEHRPKPIVQMGLFMDTNGIPISYRLFRGNQTDPITYLPAIEQVKKQFGLERIVVVADKAMNSTDNISGNLHKGDGWLFSQKHRGRRGAPKDIQEQILKPEGWLFNETETFAKKSYIRERKLGKRKDSPCVQEKVLITWNKKYADREKIRREGALDYARKLTNAELFRTTCKKGGKRYLELTYEDSETGEIKPYSPVIQIDQEQIDFDAQFDGVNVLVTSEIEMSDEEMLENYGQLYKIEDCFRVTKTDLSSRPVYVWTESHIRGHFLTCFLSLVLLRVLQHMTKWQWSSARLMDGFRSAQTLELPQGYQLVQGNQNFQDLCRYLEINWQLQYVKKEQVKTFSKGWCKTFFERTKNSETS